MPTLDVHGAHLYYELHGATGPVVLLIPGGNGDAAPYAPLARLISDRFRAVTYDRRGFSRSTLAAAVPADRLRADTADVLALLDVVDADGAPAHVSGPARAPSWHLTCSRVTQIAWRR